MHSCQYCVSEYIILVYMITAYCSCAYITHFFMCVHLMIITHTFTPRSLEQHIHTLRDELDSLRAMNSRLTMMGPPQQPPMHPQRDSVHSVDADAIAMHSQGGPQGELHQLKVC